MRAGARALYCRLMIFSRRLHRWGDATLEQQRALAPTWVVRRCRFGGIFEDERPLRTLGRGTDATRTRMSVVLTGRIVAFVGDLSWELETGDAMVVSPLADLFIADLDSSTGFEIDWAAGPLPPFATRLRLSGEFLATAVGVAESLRVGDQGAFAAAARRLFERVTVEGLPPLDAEALDCVDQPSQLGLSALDAVLNDLVGKPQLSDLEQRLGCSRWTLMRSFRQLHDMYGLSGLSGGTDWRAMRAFTRLRVAGLLLTHPKATTRAIADSVGFRSPEAMCHAFANAGWPSPGSFRRTG
jgi:AraC-like DNA-binding protein